MIKKGSPVVVVNNRGSTTNIGDVGIVVEMSAAETIFEIRIVGRNHFTQFLLEGQITEV